MRTFKEYMFKEYMDDEMVDAMQLPKSMKTRRHHNNKGRQQIKSGSSYRNLKRLAKRLKIKIK